MSVPLAETSMNNKTNEAAMLQANRTESQPQPGAGGPSPSYLAYLKKMKQRLFLIRLSQLLVLVVFLCGWELSARMHWVDPMLTSMPTQMIKSFANLLGEGNILYHTWITAKETVFGIAISMVLGTLIAILFWWSGFVSKVLDPYIVVLNALPKVALGPIFYIWLGDRMSIYGMAVAISVIVTIMMVESGFKEISKSKLKLMESFGATRWQMLKMVLLPASIPNLVATVKVNVGLTLVGVIMGEFLSSKAGLGYTITYGGQVFQMNLVMTSIALLAILSIVLYGIVSWVGNRLLKKYHFEK